jgi:hypothetical protein
VFAAAREAKRRWGVAHPPAGANHHPRPTSS